MKDDIRSKVLQAVDDGQIDKDTLLNAMINYLSWDDVEEMLRLNCLDEVFEVEDPDEEEDED